MLIDEHEHGLIYKRFDLASSWGVFKNNHHINRLAILTKIPLYSFHLAPGRKCQSIALVISRHTCFNSHLNFSDRNIGREATSAARDPASSKSKLELPLKITLNASLHERSRSIASWQHRIATRAGAPPFPQHAQINPHLQAADYGAESSDEKYSRKQRNGKDAEQTGDSDMCLGNGDGNAWAGECGRAQQDPASELPLRS
jgi:hypothetical protein